MWKLAIIRTQNGYILKGTDLDMVLEETEDELRVHENLLWEVMEYFNFVGSKHDAERLRIKREKKENNIITDKEDNNG